MKKEIRITENGPYLVSGRIPLEECALVNENGLMVLKTIRTIETDETYALCRCGNSMNAPFCDGSHEAVSFDGSERASREPYRERAGILEGPEINLLDDNRCAYARFCHKHRGDVWTLTELSDDEENKKEAIEAANGCIAGRLTIVNHEGNLVEPELDQKIRIIQDNDQGTSAGIFVSGSIPLYSADGFQYELRNRYTLCRCGSSRNKPFCDASHISINYQDK